MRDQYQLRKDNKNMTYQVVCLSDLLKETDANGGRISNSVLDDRPLPILIDIHIVLESFLRALAGDG